jgi:type III secretion protein C
MLGVEHDSQSSISSFKSPGPIATAKTSASATNATSTGTTPGIKKPDALTIEAYPALNAVLIKDQSDKFNYYDELIKSLDIKAQQVEISALIVDVDVDKLNEWSAGLTIGDSQHSVSSQPDRNALESKATPNIGNLSPTLVIWGQNQLSLRLRALESNGRAEVLSRPSILTMSDQSAVLDMNRTAYFKLIGERSVDLKSMTVGTMLRVTPHVLGDVIDDGIRIDIDIEDGSIDSAGEQGDTPLTTRSTISTQAVVKTHQALVIGGYRREQNQDIKSRVPLLSNLPIFGKLFSNELTGTRQRERLFVLTARVLDADK